MTNPVQPPIAKRERKVTDIHGYQVTDDYFWLRNKEDPDVIDYLNQENDYTSSVMNDTKVLQETLFQEMKSRIKEDDQSVPVKIDEFYYYNRTEKDKNYSIHCRKFQNMDSKEVVLLDENKLADGFEFFDIGDLGESSNHTQYAYTVDTRGYEEYKLVIFDIDTSEIIDDNLEKISDSFDWHPNGKSVFYSMFDESHRPSKIFEHQVGGPQSKDVLLYEDTNNEFSVEFYVTRTKRFLIIISEASDTSEIRYLDLQSASAQIILLRKREDGIEYSITTTSTHFYLLSNENAINFKLVSCSIDDAQKNMWAEVMQHNEAVYLLSISAFETFIAIFKREEGSVGIILYYPETEKFIEIRLPEEVRALGYARNPVYASTKYRFSYSSLTVPPTTYEYNTITGKLVILKQNEVKNYDPDQFTAHREFVKTKDGNIVPISILHQKSNVLSDPSPIYLTGYGSYGSSLDPGFSHTILSLVSRGFVYVIAHIRGGSELGKSWYLDGKLLNKKNTFTDFIAVAEYLIQSNYTTSKLLSIYGASAGGLLVGAVLNLNPKLFGAAIARVPFVDAVNTMLDDTIPLTSEEYREWGPLHSDIEYFEYVKSYSPYDNVTGQELPHLLVTGGLNDARVHFWEPAKWVAKMRTLIPTSNILLLKTQMTAGHSGSSGRYNYLKDLTFLYAFVIKYLGLDIE